MRRVVCGLYDQRMNGHTCLILTATVDVRSIPQLARSDIRTRLGDYSWALRQWLECDEVENVVFVENSGYDLGVFQEIAKNSSKRMEFLSFDCQDFPRNLGKGYGEALNLEYVINNSEIVAENRHVLIRANGRQYVENIASFIGALHQGTEMLCDLTQSLTWADESILGGTIDFFKSYVCPYGRQVDDSRGFYFEHALARAVHRGIADGLIWSPYPELPLVRGFSGTSNRSRDEGLLIRKKRELQHKLKLRMLRL